MSAASEKPTSKRGGDLSHRLRVEKGSRQLDVDKNPCIKVKSSATKLITRPILSVNLQKLLVKNV